MSSVDLVESPKKIFSGTVHVVSPRVVGEIFAKGRAAQFLPEEVDFVQE